MPPVIHFETVIAMDDFLDLVDFVETDPILGISLEDLQRLNQSVETLRDLQERCMQARAAVKAALVVVAPAPNTPEPGPTTHQRTTEKQVWQSRVKRGLVQQTS